MKLSKTNKLQFFKILERASKNGNGTTLLPLGTVGLSDTITFTDAGGKTNTITITQGLITSWIQA